MRIIVADHGQYGCGSRTKNVFCQFNINIMVSLTVIIYICIRNHQRTYTTNITSFMRQINRLIIKFMGRCLYPASTLSSTQVMVMLKYTYGISENPFCRKKILIKINKHRIIVFHNPLVSKISKAQKLSHVKHFNNQGLNKLFTSSQ